LYNKILVAVDGSEMSIKALDYGVMFSLKFSSKLTLISVIEEFKLPFAAVYSLWSAESRNRLEKEIYEGLNNAVNTVKEKFGDLNIQVRVEEGALA
jgi:nucleotide-binding universal stress UspA family protein